MRISIHRTMLIIALVVATGCHDQPTGPSPLGPSITSVTPDSAVFGSSDLTVTVTGTGFVHDTRTSSVVKWAAGSTETVLATTFLSETELTAVIPATLLRDGVTAVLRVANVDKIFGVVTSQESNVKTFTVLGIVISSISPTSAIAGSPDLTVVVTGRGFIRFANHLSSYVKWVVNRDETVLATTFVSEMEVTAVIPAALLKFPMTAQILVQNADIMDLSDGYNGYPKSNSINFTVVTTGGSAQ